MPQSKISFTGASRASWRQVRDAFEKAGIEVSYVKKMESGANAGFLVSFADEAEMRRALNLTIEVAGERLRPAPNRHPAAHHSRSNEAERSGTSGDPPHLEPRPYAHIRVPEQSTELPVTWHDGTAQGRISGELRCTLTALTPLLVGNEQYKLSEVRDARQVAGDGAGCYYQVPWFGEKRVHGNRAVLEPLRDERGRVLIPGEPIKGMVRQSVGALLGAPMERVKEQSFSYRPNLVWPGDGQHLILEPRPAIVKAVRTFTYKGRDYRLPDQVDLYPMERARFNRGQRLGHRYRGGMEGWENGFPNAPALANRFLHTSAEPPGNRPDRRNIRIDDSVHSLWAETYCHLIDQAGGHISPRHPSLGNHQADRSRAAGNLERAAQRGFAAGDMIFVEWDTERNRVVSYGHHYYYRWRYLNTVCTCRETNGNWALRPEVSPRPAELKQDPDGRPSRLTGARALFGYTGDSDINAGIGAGDFTQLAGRISFNMAVEQVSQGAPEDERFLGLNSGFAIPLRELATPKPSAVEFYVDQSRLNERRQHDRGVVITYGDLPGWDPPGDLVGRKFYRHNPRAARDAGQYAADSDADLCNERAVIARFVSKPGTQFRFKVRFRDLSKAELGALFIALCPDQFARKLPEATRAKADVKTDGTADQPRYATKLGYARPLGWGSVRVTVDAAYGLSHSDTGFRLERIADNTLEECFDEAAGLLNRRALREWLAIHDFKDSHWAPYPQRAGKIFKFHAEVRQKHARGRRQRP